MRLDLNIDKLAGPGRRQIPLEFSVVRPLERADFEQLAVTDRGVVPAELKRVTDRHHALARLLASGLGEGEAALAIGMHPTRVSQLKNSPAFQELVNLRRKEAADAFLSTFEHMSGLSHDAVMELRERIEEAPEKFSNKELLALVTDLYDRTGQTDRLAQLPEVIELIAVQPDAPAEPERPASKPLPAGLSDISDLEI